MKFAEINDADVNLHSIMVGFNLVDKQDKKDGNGIYIPLWSDSIPSGAVGRV